MKVTQQRPVKKTVKEDRARDAALAMRDYKAEKLAVLSKTERLRRLRLAHEQRNVIQEKTGIEPKEDH